MSEGIFFQATDDPSPTTSIFEADVAIMSTTSRLQHEPETQPTTDNQHQQLEEEQEFTLWEAMFRAKQNPNDDVGTYATTEDAIEKHRKKKEALYEKQVKDSQKRKQKQTIDSRGDESGDGRQKRKNGLLARIRKRNTREEPEPVVASSTSFEFERVSKNASTEPWEGTVESAIRPRRDDSAQRSATYRQFGGNPLDSIRVEESTKIPVPSSSEHVVVKVTVSVRRTRMDATVASRCPDSCLYAFVFFLTGLHRNGPRLSDATGIGL